MKSVIKSSDWLDLNEVHAVDWGGPGIIRSETPGRTAAVSNSAPSRAESEIEALRKSIVATEARHKEEIAQRVEQARQEAAAEYRRRDEEALAVLSAALSETSEETLQRLASAEQLALLMCDAALSRLFSDAAGQKDLLVRAIRRQAEQLRSELILKVRVSAMDFPDRSSLQALGRTLGGSFEVVHDAELEAGRCRLDLRLGHIDLSLPDFWKTLQAEFRRLAAIEARA
ncbi:MAG TPA: hypothetical protein VGO52_06210 [Hyphomonadaceae bacterium]|jgi:type III secretion protein L|nr:hypothetical protein [Hyphomonadaceae bacterium]